MNQSTRATVQTSARWKLYCVMRSEAYRSSLLRIAVFVNENDEKLLRHVHGLASDPENKNVE